MTKNPKIPIATKVNALHIQYVYYTVSVGTALEVRELYMMKVDITVYCRLLRHPEKLRKKI